MRKAPFLVFALVMSLLIGGLISFMQGPRFAAVVKSVLAKYMPADLGIEGDFTGLEVKLYPPGISILGPRLRVLERNIAQLPAGSTVDAERVDLEFRPVQMFSGNIRVHEVTVVNGDVKLLLGNLQGSKKKAARPEFHWDQLFQVHAEAIRLSGTRLHVEAKSPAFTADLVAESARLAQWSGSGGLGYELDLRLKSIGGSFLKGLSSPQAVERATLVAHVNAVGMQVDSLEVEADGASVSARGSVKGDFLEPKTLVLEADVKAAADLERAIRFAFRDPKGRPEASGRIAFDGRMRASPERFVDTLRAEGTLTGRSVRFRQWSAASAKAELGWQSSARGGELAVTRATISSPERERSRSGGERAGDGGRIEIGSFKMDLASFSRGASGGRAFSVPLNLHRAHLHWLAAPVLKHVYGLDLRATGPADLAFRPAEGGRPWELEAKVGLNVESFGLDNQKLGLAKPLKTILSIPKIRVEGGVVFDPGSFRPVNLVVSAGKSSFKGSGKVDFKSGFDLFFHGAANLEDVRQIAEIDIRGAGPLAVHVRGPAAAVSIDFDPELKNAEYLKLRLGDVKGRITWDDDRNRLLFTRMAATRGRTAYGAEGMIDLGPGKNSVDLTVRVPKGELEDLLPVFDSLVSDLGWFPRELRGSARGEVRVTGGLGVPELVIDSTVAGEDWEYWGERFSTVSLQGGIERGKYQIKEFRGIKRAGQVIGRVSYDADRVLDWGVHSENFTVGDLDHVTRLDVPMRGRVSMSSAGRGKEGRIESSTQVRLDDFAVRGAMMPPSHLVIKSERGKAEVTGSALGGQGTLEAVYDFNPGGVSAVKAELKQLDFSPVILLLNPKLIQDRSLVGRVSGSLGITFVSGKIDHASGQASLSEYLLAKTGARFELARPVATKITDGSFDLRELALRGGQAEASLDVQSRAGAIEGAVSGGIDVSIAEFFSPAVGDANGVADLDFLLGGAIKAPTFSGKASFEGVTVRVPALESPFENASGAFLIRQNIISVQGVEADLAGGRVSAEGAIHLFADRAPQVALKGALSGNKLRIFPFQFVKVHGGLDVRGDKLPYAVDGQVTVESALSKEKVLGGQKKGEALKTLQYTPPPTRSRGGDRPLFKLNIAVEAEDNVLIQNDLFDAEFKGRFTVVNTLEAPRILGEAEAIGGKLLFKDRVFQIQSANAVFDNPTTINPSFALAAGTDVSGTKIQMYVTGRLDSWKIELSSNPVMPEGEILSLLAIGISSSDARRLTAGDRSVLEQGEAASLLLHSLDFNREVQRKTGLQIQLDESVAPVQQGMSVFKPQSAADSIAQPKIVIRRQIGKRFELSYGTTIGGASTTTSGREVNAEYKLTPGMSVMGVWNNYQTIDASDRISLGADLKFQKRFK